MIAELPIPPAMSSQPSQTNQSFYARAQAAQAVGRFDEAVQLLWHATRLGDVACMSLLGAQLMSGRGVRPNLALGAQLIIDAAKGGGAYACAVAANILASGFSGSRAPDWTGALDYLQRSAELGHEPAQAQLRVLARRGKKAPTGPSAWQQLRRSIDLDAWRASRPAPCRTIRRSRRWKVSSPRMFATGSWIAPAST